MSEKAALSKANQTDHGSMQPESDLRYAKAEEEKLIRNLKRTDRDRLQLMLRLMQMGRMLQQGSSNKG